MGRRKVRLGGDLRSSLERARRRADYVRLDGREGNASLQQQQEDPQQQQQQKRRGGRIKPQALRLGGGRRWRWKLAIARLRVRFVSPVVLQLKRLRDAYERLMIRLAESNGSHQILLANTGVYAMGIPGAGTRFIYG